MKLNVKQESFNSYSINKGQIKRIKFMHHNERITLKNPI